MSQSRSVNQAPSTSTMVDSHFLHVPLGQAGPWGGKPRGFRAFSVLCSYSRELRPAFLSLKVLRAHCTVSVITAARRNKVSASVPQKVFSREPSASCATMAEATPISIDLGTTYS